MPENRPHKETVNRLLWRFGAEPQKKGADIQTPSFVAEVEPERTLSQGIQQLQGYKKPVYLVPTSERGVKKALELTAGMTIGVMGPEGNIIKPSTRCPS